MANYVFARLCDNDFGFLLQDALEYVAFSKEGGLSEEDYKWHIIEYVMFHNRKVTRKENIDATKEATTRLYLEKNLSVTFERHAPTVDHDGGSAVLDASTMKAWRI